jgi:hypothetical protein
VILGHNPPEIAYLKRGEWWLAGDAKPWHPEAVTVASDRLVFKPRLAPVGGMKPDRLALGRTATTPPAPAPSPAQREPYAPLGRHGAQQGRQCSWMR